MKKEKVEFDNLSYKELQEIHSKLRKDFIEVDKRLKGFDKSIGICSDCGCGSYKPCYLSTESETQPLSARAKLIKALERRKKMIEMIDYQ